MTASTFKVHGSGLPAMMNVLRHPLPIFASPRLPTLQVSKTRQVESCHGMDMASLAQSPTGPHCDMCEALRAAPTCAGMQGYDLTWQCLDVIKSRKLRLRKRLALHAGLGPNLAFNRLELLAATVTKLTTQRSIQDILDAGLNPTQPRINFQYHSR
jgi:hypothetical protein